MGKKTACQQLNCYRGFDDEALQNHMREFKAKMDQCQPEKDLPDDHTILEGGEGKAALQNESNQLITETEPHQNQLSGSLDNQNIANPRKLGMGGFAGAAMAVFLTSSIGSSSSSIGIHDRC